MTTLPLTLACGPYIPFDETGFRVALVTFLALKPVAYFAFIHAFRYRVNRAIPMSWGRAVKLALARAALGVLLVGVGIAAVTISGSDTILALSWLYLYGGRAAAWYVVGRWGAVLGGRRLTGWVVSGTMLNAAFDFAAVAGIFAGWIWPASVMLGLAVFIAVLDRIGRRDALRRRFKDARYCMSCSYDLTGNLSGRCPECSRPVAAAATILSAR